MQMDIPWSVGFIAGAACSGLVLKSLGLGYHQIVNMLIVVGVGVCCGWLADTLFSKKPKP